MSAAFSGSPLIGTGSTTYSKPWELARRFATLDHLSGGRAGWNIVTTVTPLAAAAFGEPAHPGHADRYARAHEFVDVVLRAWDNWEDDAVVGDRENGVWADRGKLHDPRFHGKYYDSEGVLPFPRSPQGHPVLVQAGQSGAGAGLAARYAELVFSGPPSLAEQLCAIARARPGASLREVAQQVTGGAGQTHFIGTPEQLAAHVVAWQDAVGLQAPSGFVVVAIGTAAMAISPCLGLSPYVWLSIGASLTGLGNGLANPASRNACLQVAPDEVGPAGAAPTACTTNTSHPVRHNPICMVVTP